jgi:hypothetical protein
MVDNLNDPGNARDDYALQQSVLALLGQHALVGADLEQLFAEAVKLVRQTLRIDYATVVELRSGGETLVGRAAAGFDAEVVRTLVAETGARSHAGYALLVNAPVIVTDFSTEQRLHSSIAERWGLRSGVIVVNSRPRPALRSARGPRPEGTRVWPR